MHGFPRRSSLFVVLIAALVLRADLYADPVPVRRPQGSAHGFLVLKTLDGIRLATGDITQTVTGSRLTTRTIFHFRDGSIDDETTVFSQHGTLRLIRDHHIQRGPFFPQSIDILIERETGEITSHSSDGKITQNHLDLPEDLSNGMALNLLMNIDPSTLETKLSFVAPTTKPRLVHVSIKNAGKVSFTIAGSPRKAIDYVLHMELGGVTGVIAPILGKQPSDYHVWILDGPSPAFIREEGQLYQGGPICRIEQISASFSH